MAAVALLKFTQATQGTAGNGIAMVGVMGQVVTITNASNTDVQSWQIDLVYADPDSSIDIAIPYAFSDNGSTPTATFTPDRRRSFRWQLKVWAVINRAGSPSDTDIRVFTVREVNGLIITPAQIYPTPLPDPRTGAPGNKPNEMNFDGQPDGWAGTSNNDGLLNDTLTKVLNRSTHVRYVDNGTSLPFSKQNGGQTTPYGSIQTALDEVQTGGNNGSKWVIALAPGNYDESLTIPKQRSITIVGESFDACRVNMNSGLPISWNIEGSCYLALVSLQCYRIQTVDAGSDPPDMATLYLENASIETILTESYTLDVVATGPNTHINEATLTGRLAVDGANYIGSITCGAIAAYDTMMPSGAYYTISGSAIFTDVQIDTGVTLDFNGYSQNVYVDGATNYWIYAHGTTIAGSPTFIVMDTGNLYPPKEIESTSYMLARTDQGKFFWTVNGSNVTVTIPLDDTVPIPVGTQVFFQQRYTGVIILAAEGGVDLMTRTSLQTANVMATIWALKTAPDTWAVGGDLAPGQQAYPFSGSSNTLMLTQLGRLVIVSDGSTTTVTVPTNATQPFPVGTKVDFLAGGLGQVVFAPVNGSVTLLSAETLKLRKQYSMATLTKIFTDTWVLSGDLELS